jgi:hypothetical protein
MEFFLISCEEAFRLTQKIWRHELPVKVAVKKILHCLFELSGHFSTSRC